MTIFDVVEKFLLAGFGAQEKAGEFVDELVKKGELSESQGAKIVKEWTKKIDKGTSELTLELTKSVAELVAKTLEKITIPSKEDMEKLNKKIDDISERVKKMEK